MEKLQKKTSIKKLKVLFSCFVGQIYKKIKLENGWHFGCKLVLLYAIINIDIQQHSCQYKITILIFITCEYTVFISNKIRKFILLFQHHAI